MESITLIIADNPVMRPQNISTKASKAAAKVRSKKAAERNKRKKA